MNKMRLHIITTIGLLISLSYGLGAQATFSLSEAIDYALEHHPSLHVADLDEQTAEWQYKEVLATGMPKVNGNLDYTYYYKVPVTPTEDFITPLVTEAITGMPYTGEPEYFEFAFLQKNQLNVGLSGDFLIFDGNFLKGLKASKLFIDLSKKQVNLTKQDIIQNVAKAYQNVLIAERNVNILENNINNISKALRETTLIYENGFAEELDVDRLKLSLENLEFEKKKLEQVIAVSYNVLKYQMAYPIHEELSVTEELETVVDLILLDGESSGEIDFTQRPEHNILMETIELNKADLERIKQAYLPTVTGNIGYAQVLQRNNLFDSEAVGFLGNGSVGIRTRIPIYDGGMTKAKIAQKKIEIEKIENDLSEFDRGMKLQIYNAEAQYENAKLSLENAKRSLALNEKIYDKTQIKYREGVGSSVEVTQAEASLYQAQANYINALYDLLTSKTELDIATGEILKNKINR